MKVHILPEAHAQIMYYVNKSSVEISGLGRIEKDSQGNMVVTKVYLLDQENTSATTDIDAQAMAKLMYETREDKGNLNFWWHSHVNMATFWSGTDMATIKQFGKNGYLLATVFNKQGDHRTAYFQGGTDFLPELFIDQIDTKFTHIPKLAETTVWEAEFNTKCKSKTFTHTGKSWADDKKWGNYGQYGFDLYGDDDDDFDYYGNRMAGKASRKGTLLTGDMGKSRGAESVGKNAVKPFIDFDNLSVPDFSDWQEIFGLLKGQNPDLIDIDKLKNFYNAWKGDYDSAEKYVCDKVEREIEGYDKLDRALDKMQSEGGK